MAQVSRAVVGTSCLLVRRLFDVNSGDVAGSGASTPEANGRQQPLSSVHVHCEGSLGFLQLGGVSLTPPSILVMICSRETYLSQKIGKTYLV